MKLDMYEEAKTVMEAAIQNCSDIGQLYYYTAQMAQRCGNLDDYEQYLNQAIINKNTLSIDVYRVMAELEKLQDSK